jgi:protein involved in polysaccharide export with SLBB domain
MSYHQADGHEMLRDIGYSLAICSIALILANLGARNTWPATYALQPFDTIRCKFILDPQLNEDLLIRPDGMITLQIIGDVRAAGLSPQGLARRIEDKFMETGIVSRGDEKFLKNKKFVTIDVISTFPMNTPLTAPYELKPFDTITCKFILDPQLNEDLFVRPDGMITLQAIGDVRAAGLRPQDLAKRIEDKFVQAKIFSKDDKKRDLKNYKLVTVHVISIFPTKTPLTAPYELKPFDTIRCKFILDPQLNEDLRIRSDGMITLRAMGEIRAAGLRPQDLAKRIEDKFVQAKIFSKNDWKVVDPKICKLVTVHLIRIYTRPQEE